MGYIDVERYLIRKPFVPFLIRVTDGTVITVKHPEFVLVGVTAIEVGLQKREGSLLVEKVVSIALSHIVKLEPIENTESVTA